MTKRPDQILKILGKEGKISVLDLAERLEVSPATIRQDLTMLENEGLLKRTHGGAELNESDDLYRRMAINYDEKLKIARKAVEFVTPGETIFVESGSINALFVRELAAVGGVTVITSNAIIARSIDQSKGCDVVLIGGMFQDESESLVGNLAKLCIESLNFNKVFLGVDGFTFETGFTGRNMMRAEIAELIVRRGRDIFVLSDSSKFGRVNMSRYCGLESVHHIITDVGLGEAFRAGFAGKVDLQLV